MPSKDQLTVAGFKTLKAIGTACKASPKGVCDFYSLNRNGGVVTSAFRLTQQGLVVKEVVNGFAEWRLTEQGIEVYNRSES